MDRSPSPFSFWVPLDMEKSVEDSEIRSVCGIISTEDADLDREHIHEELSDYRPMLEQMGQNVTSALSDKIDWDRFSTRHGYLKWEHGTEPGNIIGIPERIEKGVTYHDPVTKSVKTGTAIWGRLFPPDAGVQKANEAWDLIQAIRKSGFPRKLGYSIEGAYVPVPDLPPAEKACMITNVVITTKPVNSWTWADMAKALVAGPGNTDSAAMEDGEALRRQSLYPNKLETHQGGECPHKDASGKWKSKEAALEHLVKCKGMRGRTAAKAVVEAFGLRAA